MGIRKRVGIIALSTRLGAPGLALLAVFLALTACGTSKAPPAAKPLATSRNEMSDVLGQPLTDLNISPGEIPALLLQVEQAPYVQPTRLDCAGLQFDINQLTKLVGPDIETRKSISHEAIISRNSSSDTAWEAAHSAASAWIPFRSAVRFFTGANRQERRINDAILAGFVRRAYLKGLRDLQRCPTLPPPPLAAKPK